MKAIPLTLAGVVAAPRFVLGVTTPAEWKVARSAPGPWAELEGRHMVLTVPSAAIREYDDPAALMTFWDSVLESHCVLAGIPIPARRERFVADAQISAGYMHSGYPIMMHLDQVEPAKGGGTPPLLDLAALKTKGSWGCFHELGHNRQRRWWTFSGTGEVTCNWFSLFTGERICGIEPWRNPWIENQKAKVAKHLAAGAPFDRWKSQPGLALMTYAQVQRRFGWQPFVDVVAQYEAMPAKRRPRGDQACIDGWVRRMSIATGHDLRPFHLRWGWPLGAALRADGALGKLKPWNPDPADLAHFDAMTPPK
ncbi:MAG: M60 family metallopeptidase [Planctomycetota bacterium]